MRRVFRVEIDVPAWVAFSDIKEYIEDAINSWGGQYSVDDWRSGATKTRRISVWHGRDSRQSRRKEL